MGKKEAIAGALKKVGTKAAPVIKSAAGKIAGGAGAAAGAAKGAVLGAGLKVGEEAVGAVKDHGFILFILGLVTFFFNEYLGNLTLGLIIGVFFLFYSSLLIFKGKGIAITVIFCIWYIFLGGTRDPEILKYYIIPMIITGMIVHGLYNKFSKKGDFMEGARGEVIGFIFPVVFFFLDLGLIQLLTQPPINLSLTPLVINLVKFTPWWAILGIFTTKKENVFISIFKIVAIIYLISILTFGVAPEAYDSYTSEISPERFQEAKEEVMGKLPQGENPALSNFACTWESITNPAKSLNIAECIKKRQEESEIKYTCKNIRELEPGTSAYEDCLKEERKKKKESALLIAGTEDPTVKEPTKAEFKVSEYSPKITYQARYPYSIQLEIKNPRKQELNIDIECFFKKGTKKIPGITEPQGFIVAKEEDIKSITCTPAEDLDGFYTLAYQANIHNLKTTSRLTRLFVGDAEEKMEGEIEELKRTYMPGKQYLSQAPKEFARINFGFGEPETNPLIEHDDKPLLVSTIENVGGGKILTIKNYHIALEKEGITPIDRWECFSVTAEKLQDINTYLSKIKTSFRETIPLTTCFIEIPEDLMNPPDFFFKEFIATLDYDYQIEKEIKTEVKILVS